MTPNPRALESNDCTAPPTRNGTQVHSPVLGATVTLPVGWAENPADEGQQGPPAAFDIATGSPGDGANISSDFFRSTMSPHDAANAEAAYTPGSGTVVAKGDCTIGGGQASFFESSIPQLGSVGYGLYIAHSRNLVRLVIVFPETRRASTMPEVKSILGSWQWDQA